MEKKGKFLNLFLAILIAVTAVIGASFSLPQRGVQAQSIIYVPDNYPTIQAAVDAASPGDTIIVRDGIYTENVDVNKDHLTIKSESGAEATIVQAANPDDHVFEVTADYVEISGFTVQGTVAATKAAIHLLGTESDNVKHCHISHNIVSAYLIPGYGYVCNYNGIGLFYSSNNVVSNNTVSRSWSLAIGLEHSDNNTLINNTVTGWLGNSGIFLGVSSNNTLSNNIVESCGGEGISILFSSHNILTDNTLSNNRYNLDIDPWNPIHNIDTSNTVNGKPIQYIVNKNDLVIDSTWDVGYLGIVNSHNITVKDLVLSNNGQGVLVSSSNNSRVENVNVHGNRAGFTTVLSSNNQFVNNTVDSNYTGFFLWGDLTDNTIRGNMISNNQVGIFYGFRCYSNAIYLNNFINNAHIVGSSDSTNIWNSPQEITYTYGGNTYTNYLGNYWSDYAGSDADGDGIGDTPYTVDIGVQDRYPFMKESGWEASPGDAARMELLPASGINQVGTNHDLTSTVYDEYDNVVPGQAVTWEITSGPGDFVGTPEGTTDALGEAYATITSSVVGTTTVRCSVSENICDGATKDWTPTVSAPWSFAIITDLHIGRGYTNCGYDYNGEQYYLTERLRDVVSWINGNHDSHEIDFVVVLGDIGEKGTVPELQTAKEILEELDEDVPYIPMMGNHDAAGRENFNTVFKDQIEELETQLSLVKDYDASAPYLQNYAFGHNGVKFIFLDCSKDGPEAYLYDSTFTFLDEQLGAVDEEVVALFCHHPLWPTGLTTFDEPAFYDGFECREVLVSAFEFIVPEIRDTAFDKIQRIINDAIDQTGISVWSFGGHVHGFEKFLGVTDIFFNANRVYPEPNWNPDWIPVVTTEATMVGSNMGQESIIRIVRVDGYELDYDNFADESFAALNPRFDHWMSQYVLTGGVQLPMEFTFMGESFTKRQIASYEWDFGPLGTRSGQVVHITRDELSQMGSDSMVKLPVKLTVTDAYDAHSEYMQRAVEINLGPAWYLLTSPGILPLSMPTWQNLSMTVDNRGDVKVLVNVERSEAKPVAAITVNFDQATANIDLTTLAADVDLVARKSFFYTPSWPPEIEESKVLFIPSTGVGTVYICPDATSLAEVSLENADVIINVGETKNGITVTTTVYNGEEYYVVYGVTGTGGGEGLPPVPPVGGTIIPTDKLGLVMPWIMAAALIVVAGVSLAVWNRRRGGERHSGQ